MASLRPILVVAATACLVLALTEAATSAAPHRPRLPRSSHDAEPETTATPQARSAKRTPDQAPPAGAIDDETLPPPFHLPTASRARMRDCGLKWQAMKLSGEAGDDIWRDYATRCLAAATGPFEKR